MLQNGVGTGLVQLVLVHSHVFYDAINDQQDVAFAAHAHAGHLSLHPDQTREFAAAVGQRKDPVRGSQLLDPVGHHKCVVHRDDGDHVNVLVLQRLKVFNKARDVGAGTLGHITLHYSGALGECQVGTVGVKAPGTPTRTTVRFENTGTGETNNHPTTLPASVDTFIGERQVPSPPILAVLKVNSGILSPTSMAYTRSPS